MYNRNSQGKRIESTAPGYPLVRLQGTNISPFLYGDTIFIRVQNNRTVTRDDLLEIKRTIAQMSFGTAFRFGNSKTVELGPILNEVVDIKPGVVLLILENCGSAVRKTLTRVLDSRLSQTGDNYQITIEHFWPLSQAGIQEIITERDLFDITHDSKGDEARGAVYLTYEGPNPDSLRDGQQKASRQSQFFAFMMQCAVDLRWLVQAWACVMNPQLMNGKLVDVARCEEYWLAEFTKRCGRLFYHDRVWSQLKLLCDEGVLTGISDIYDTSIDHDIITPLLSRLQIDIRDSLMENAELVTKLFDSRFWQRYICVVLEREYGITTSEKEFERSKRVISAVLTTVTNVQARKALLTLYKLKTGEEYKEPKIDIKPSPGNPVEQVLPPVCAEAFANQQEVTPSP